MLAPMESSAPPSVIRTEGLSKRFGRLTAVSSLDLDVRPGRVFGFLGPNGAGKTTAIAMILGLLFPTSGNIQLFGMDARTNLKAALRRVGAIVENPAVYPHLTARDNLRVWGALSGGTTPARIDEVLELVGLRERAKDKPRTYSLGMKQRLGLGAALLHDPELLILDEPTNGLDPAGIREFRELFRAFARRGKTVFVSSHLLGEVQLMCDEVAIVKQGRLIAQGEVGELLRRREAFIVRTTDPAQAVSVLGSLDWVRSVSEGEQGSLLVEAPAERAAGISQALGEGGIWISELRQEEGSLEDFFLEVTGREDGAG
ncbi:MAG: ABC transporter ATP-binding protein [Dehalococcoidia bacterium]